MFRVNTTRRPVPRWALVAAWTTVLCTVPSAVWRVFAAFGADVGFTGKLAELYSGAGFAVYMWTLNVVSLAAASLTLGLVKPWGEVVPRWAPGIGGKRIPPALVVGVACLGAAVLVALSVVVALTDASPLRHPNFPSGTAGVVAALCYAPLLAWGPLVAVLAIAYARRRCRDDHGDQRLR